jgi:tetratricopeptide (TPR) repeat protein
MKTIFSFVGILFLMTVNAQKFDCSSKTTSYQELFKAKKLAESFEIWTEVKKNCPKESESLYTDGFKILQYKIDNATTEEEKTTLVRDKMELYDQYNKYFPLSTADYEVSKAMVLHDNKIQAKDEIFTLFNNGFTNAPKSISNAKAIYLYYSLCYEKYKEGNKNYSSDIIIEKYMLVNSMLTNLQDTRPEKSQEYRAALRAINNLSKDVTTCDNLGAYYEKNYQANIKNINWITTALTSLSEKCSALPIFATMAEKLYSTKATSQSAYFMALSYTKQKKFSAAIEYYNNSAQMQPNPLEKAAIYYTLATGLSSGDKSKSKEYINKALTYDPKMGKAYFYLAQIYSSSKEECGKTDFEKKSVIYLAIQTANKAGTVDSKLKPAANKMVENLTPHSLTKEEIKKAKMNGKSQTIGCWINETITFPSK